MQDIIQLGPLTIYIPYAFFGIAAILAVVWSRILMHLKHIDNRSKIASEWFHSWIIFIFIWKLSYILFHPIDAFKSPLRILYFNGGDLGLLIGLIGATILFLKNTSKWVNHVKINLGILVSTSVMFYSLFEIGNYILYPTFSHFPLYKGIFFGVFSLLFLQKNGFKKSFLIRNGQWLLFGWIGFRIFESTHLLTDWILWIAFIGAIGLVLYDFQLFKKGSEQK